jgi:hypothetical protein
MKRRNNGWKERSNERRMKVGRKEGRKFGSLWRVRSEVKGGNEGRKEVKEESLRSERRK